MGEAMADQDMFHTLEIVKAAIPYVDSRSKVMAEFFVKAIDLMGSLKSISNPKNLAACGFEVSKFDLEGLLNGIRPVCNIRERVFVDQILNFFNMRKMFEMYNNMMSAMKAMQGFDGFPFGDSGTGDDTDTVKGNFSGMNFESIFKNFGNNPFSGSSDSYTDTKDATSDTIFDHFDNTVQSDDSNSKIDTEEMLHNEDNNSNAFGNTNNKMFDMLKAMVPPEQLSTFENLSMLLNTMSYDNNSRPDDSKERNDG
jgi:hypothetical protein